MLTRDGEKDLVKRCAFLAEKGASVVNDNEAAVCRLVAQLVKTRFPAAAAALNQASKVYYTAHKAHPQSFPEVVRAGLVTDLPRFRNLMERELAGHNSW
jgi:hypothetical protein